MKADKQQVSNKKELIRIQEKTKMDFLQYADKYNMQKNKVINYFKKAADRKEKIGCYVPGRFINWLNIITDISLSYKRSIRFIDDNRLLQGKYYPGFDNPVESFGQYLLNPTEKLLISSYTYEETIRKKVLDSKYKGNVKSIRELLQ